jgi:hypothetical protein
MSESIFLCPLCDRPGIKHCHRNACVECIKAQQRKRWQERKARSIGGNEPVSVANAGGWQPVMAADYLSKPWRLRATA